MRSADWIFYHWGAGLTVTGRRHEISTFYSLLFKQEAAVAAQLLPHFVPYRIPRRCIIRNTIIIKCTNYIIIFINNNAEINNNLWKIPIIYFTIQNYFGHAKGFIRNLQATLTRAVKKV